MHARRASGGGPPGDLVGDHAAADAEHDPADQQCASENSERSLFHVFGWSLRSRSRDRSYSSAVISPRANR